MFFTNGAALAGMLPRYPQIKDFYALSDAAFGLLVIAVPVGSILAAAIAAPLVRRWGPRTVTAVGTALFTWMLALVVWSPTAALFGCVLLLAGFVDAIVDAAQNVQAVAVEEWMQRSVINSTHAIWSLGATVGGLIGTVSAAAGVSLRLQMGVSAVVITLMAIVASRLAAVPAHLARGATEDARDGAPQNATEAAPPRSRPWLILVPIGLLGISGTLFEEFANSWSALFLGRETDAPAHLAGLGFTVMLGAQFVGRLLGDPMTDRWGRAPVARLGAMIIAAGVVVIALSEAYQLVMLGLMMMGFGSATLVPAAFAAAARVPGLQHGTGIALVGWVIRLGFLITSPLVGAISELSSLRVALVVPFLAALVATGISHNLARRSRIPAA